jgi:ribosomal RNA-processing protein 12
LKRMFNNLLPIGGSFRGRRGGRGGRGRGGNGARSGRGGISAGRRGLRVEKRHGSSMGGVGWVFEVTDPLY